VISILIADDHPVVRSGMKQLINSQPNMEVIDEAADGEEAVKKALSRKPDIAILDLKMPKKNGLISTKQIREANSQIKIIIFSMYEDDKYIFQCLHAGALSYIPKSHNVEELIEAIHTVQLGNVYLYSNALKWVLDDCLKKSELAENKQKSLTGREEEILSYLVKGYINREIADQLHISIKTVESHKSKIMEKLHLKSRRDLMKYAIKKGLLEFNAD